MTEHALNARGLSEQSKSAQPGATEWLFIQPQDVWMFRDNKPFSAQQSFVARSVFPPHPQTMQGAIRTLYMEQKGVDWKAFPRGGGSRELYGVVGRGGNDSDTGVTGSLRISGPFVAMQRQDKVELLVKAPQDLLFKGNTDEESPENKEGLFTSPTVADKLDFSTSQPFDDWRPLVQAGGFKAAEGWLSQEQFVSYLKNESFHGALCQHVYEVEGRVGLGMEYGRRSHQEGMLYNAHFVRPNEGVGLLAGVTPGLFGAKGTICIGGESRSSHYVAIDEFDFPTVATGNRYKIVLLTPAYFSNGAFPTNGDWSPWVGSGRLISAAIGKPVAISGWNVAYNRPRPLRHYVPAGSVFYFEGGGFSRRPFTETPQGAPDFGAAGYGSVAVGNW